MSITSLSGPLLVGPQKDQTGSATDPFNQGFAALTQVVNIPYNATLVSQALINVPAGCRIKSFDIDVLTAFNSATSATLSAGITSGGTDYVSGVNVKAATGRIAPTYTAAQLAAMSGQSVTGTASPIAAPGNLYLTITSVGQPTAGYVTVAVNYVQLI